MPEHHNKRHVGLHCTWYRTEYNYINVTFNNILSIDIILCATIEEFHCIKATACNLSLFSGAIEAGIIGTVVFEAGGGNSGM